VHIRDELGVQAANAVYEKREYHTLDAMRGVAAIVVVFLHCGTLWGGWHPASGYLAVGFFFALSGFVLEHVYGPRFARGMPVSSFMKARYVRLYPLYLLGTVAGFAGIIIFKPWLGLFVRALPAAIMLPTPTSDGSIYPFDVPAWSLFLELLVNLVFVLIWRHLRPRMLVSILFMFGAILAWCILHAGKSDLGSSTFTFLFGFPRVAFLFFLGVWLCRIHRSQRTVGWLGLLFPLLLTLALLINPGELRREYDLLWVFVCCPLLVYGGCIYEPPIRYVSIFRFLGLISYPIYVLHYPLVFFVRNVAENTHLSVVTIATLQVAMVSVAAWISWLAATKFDIPARGALARALIRHHG
jgi:peptidoglycan/LPS O-acetylase OafA/YrhL